VAASNLVRTYACAAALLGCLACSDPKYDAMKPGGDAAAADPEDGAVPTALAKEDAASPRPPSDDASATPEPDAATATTGDAAVVPGQLSADEARLLGGYLARSYGFWIDDSGGKMTVDELALADFERVGDHVELRMRVCRQSSRAAGLSLDLRSAESFPELRRKVTITEEGFTTDDHAIATGYEREGIAGCASKSGQSIPVQPDQPWLTGTCRCPSSAAEPPTLDDCRVTDPDRDRAPALSYTLAGLGVTSHLATVIRSHHVRGRTVGTRDLFAEMKVDEIGYYLSCNGSALECIDSDRFGRPCTSVHNGTQFVALPGLDGATPLSCKRAVAREAEFFPTSIPTPPATCIRDVLTDDPSRP
jgi:hypothetical protein